MTLRQWALALFLACAQALAHAQIDQQVITLNTRAGVTMKVLWLKTEAAKATVVLFAGGHGGLRLFANGSMQWGDQNFLVRTKELFAKQGVNVAVVDAPSDRQRPPFLSGFRHSAEHAQDVRVLVDALIQQSPVPVWLVGTSRGTESAASVGIRLQDHPHIKGLVLTASILVSQDGTAVPEQPLKTYPGSVLVVHHTQDSCRVTRYADLPKLRAQLNPQAPHAVLTYAEGITQGDPCQALAHHGFNGIEPQVVSDMVAWMLKH